jgi:hypothetical protein
MAITGGFGMTIDTETGLSRRWVIGRDGVKRWLDTGDPVYQRDEEPEFGDYCHDCGEDTCCCDLDA